MYVMYNVCQQLTLLRAKWRKREPPRKSPGYVATNPGGSAMGFNNFATLHSNLLPPQGDWTAYSGGYPAQDTQAYMTAQPASYSNYQNPYASYAATMFGSSGSPGGGSGAGSNTLSSAGTDTLGSPSAFYTASAAAALPPAADHSIGSHDHGSPTCGYKLDFNNIVDEKILGEPNHSGNESESPTLKNQ